MRPRRSGPLPIEDWEAALQAENQSRNTIRRRTGTIRLFAEFLEQRQLPEGHGIGQMLRRRRTVLTAAPDDIRAYLASRDWARATRRAYFDDFRAFYAWAKPAGWVDWDPTADMKSPGNVKHLPDPVETIVLHEGLRRAREPGCHRHLYGWLLLGSYAGLRRSEIATVRGEDVRRQIRMLRVLGKGGYEALTPLNELVQEEAERRPRAGFWFPGGAGGHVHPDTIYKHVVAFFRDEFGVRCTPHMLRHWYATFLLENGADPRTVQECMRHQTLGSLEGYTRVSRVNMLAAVDRLPQPEMPDAA